MSLLTVDEEIIDLTDPKVLEEQEALFSRYSKRKPDFIDLIEDHSDHEYLDLTNLDRIPKQMTPTTSTSIHQLKTDEAFARTLENHISPSKEPITPFLSNMDNPLRNSSVDFTPKKFKEPSILPFLIKTRDPNMISPKRLKKESDSKIQQDIGQTKFPTQEVSNQPFNNSLYADKCNENPNLAERPQTVSSFHINRLKEYPTMGRLSSTDINTSPYPGYLLSEQYPNLMNYSQDVQMLPSQISNPMDYRSNFRPLPLPTSNVIPQPIPFQPYMNNPYKPNMETGNPAFQQSNPSALIPESYMSVSPYPQVMNPMYQYPPLDSGYNPIYSASSSAFPNSNDNRNDVNNERVMTEAESKEHIKKLLENIECYGEDKPKEDRLKTPSQMIVQLLPHQQLGVEWMLGLENGSSKGGILADDMGLGKTIQSIALICANPPETRKPTLIVAPKSLITQWKAEIEEKTKPGTLSVYIHHGSNRTKSKRSLEGYDVVITTYSLVGIECPEEFESLAGKRNSSDTADSDDGIIMQAKQHPLFAVEWHRIILDEAHIIKNHNTKGAKASQHLKSTYRWCLSGTPIQNSVNDLFSLVRFLRIRPYNNQTYFREQISNPFKRGKGTAAIRKVKFIMEAICLRRVKNQILDGKPIITLPEKHIYPELCIFSTPEKEFYDALFNKARIQFNIYLKAGTVMKNYSHVLAWLLRLRQAACHPSLVTTSGNHDPLSEVNEENAANLVGRKGWADALKNLNPEFITRILDSQVHIGECTICFDPMNRGVILSNCGHFYCLECINTYISHKLDEERVCPQCRAVISPHMIPVSEFLKKHGQHIVKEDIGVVFCKEEDLNKTFKEIMQQSKPGYKSTAWTNEISISLKKRLRSKDKLDHVDTSLSKFKSNWVSSAKIDRLMELLNTIQDTTDGEKTIVFSQFTSFLDLIEIPLIEGRFKFARYDGTMDSKEQAASVERFKKDSECNVLLLSLKCGSLGLNLAFANHVALLDVWWNPAVEQQAIDRTHRIGQKRETHVHKITIQGTVEDRIIDLQKQKQEIVDAAFGEGRITNGMRLSLGDLMRLFEATG